MKLVISNLNDWVSRCCAAARLHAWLPGGEWFFLGRAGESVFSKLSSKMGACSNVLCRLTGLLTSAIPGISGVHFFSEICGNFILFSGFSREAIRKSFRSICANRCSNRRRRRFTASKPAQSMSFRALPSTIRYSSNSHWRLSMRSRTAGQKTRCISIRRLT